MWQHSMGVCLLTLHGRQEKGKTENEKRMRLSNGCIIILNQPAYLKDGRFAWVAEFQVIPHWDTVDTPLGYLGDHLVPHRALLVRTYLMIPAAGSICIVHEGTHCS